MFGSVGIFKDSDDFCSLVEILSITRGRRLHYEFINSHKDREIDSKVHIIRIRLQMENLCDLV